MRGNMLYKSEKEYLAKENTILTKFYIPEVLEKFGFDSENVAKFKEFNAKNAWINVGGWQSWNPGYEVESKKKQMALTCHIVKPFNSYLKFPQTHYKESKNLVLGQFIIYLRWKDFYLCFVSSGNIENVLPPVQFVVNRKENSVSVELCDKGKLWKKDELQSEIQIFCADSYFALKENLIKIFGTSDKDKNEYSKRFDQIQFLGKTAAGWESWYNHYSNIDEKLILDDLESLKSTKNIITLGNYKNPVFQIDDGWEAGLGNWEIRKDRFPNGLKSITEKIENSGYVPGLWIAPFIIDLRTPVAKNHTDWILKNEKGKPVEAGFNPLWGAKFGKEQPGFPGSFYVLDISIKEVIDYLDKIIERAIEDWGFRYLKLDFLYVGMIYGKRKNSGSSYEWYAAAVSYLTRRHANSKGQEVTYLGCGAPFELSFKDFPLCRIGCDTYEHWENSLSKRLRINGRNSAVLNLTDSIGRAFWDKIVFANDPDVIFIRNNNCSLTKNQKILIGTVAAICGSQIMYSDDPSGSNSTQETKLAEEISEIFKKYQNEEFSIKTVRENIYEVHSKSGRYNGVLNLEVGYADIL